MHNGTSFGDESAFLSPSSVGMWLGKHRAAPPSQGFLSKPVVNTAASVRQRLLNLARVRNEDFGLVLTRYALERVLYRISQSVYRKTLVLKGALLFELWTNLTHATWSR